LNVVLNLFLDVESSEGRSCEDTVWNYNIELSRRGDLETLNNLDADYNQPDNSTIDHIPTNEIDLSSKEPKGREAWHSHAQNRHLELRRNRHESNREELLPITHSGYFPTIRFWG
jgi:hypothetical protein